jgi:hypothetical protein
MEPEQQFCAQLAQQAGEPLFGTATQAKVWFLLEYREPWRAKAFADNNVPPAVQGYLAGQMAAISDSRLLFIRQRSQPEQQLRFFVARTDESIPALYEFRVDAYRDLLALDITAVVAGSGEYAAFKRNEPLFLVCTNGVRDRCCAKFGIPLYEALLDHQGDAAWQSSHIGGHRYAPNILFLPHSINYGQVGPDEIRTAVDAHRQGQLYDLSRYRGVTYYPPHVQAADYFLRRELNLLSLEGIQLRAAELVEENRWRVQFNLTTTGASHQLEIASELTEPRLVSCSVPAMKPVPRFQLIEHRVV